MSAQSAIYNPSQTTSAATGDGFSVPRLTTTGRLAIVFGTSDAGMMVYDITLNNLFIWTGSAWESVPASGDAGANGSVQYNDNGVVSGASNFIYNKATSAVSITGDLTVDTNVLKVDTTNNRVGINTASPSTALDVFGGNIRLVGGNIFQLLNSANDSNVDISNNGGAGVASMLFKVAGSSAMTLNATGLGVGVVPAGTGGCLQLKSGITFPATQVASSDANTLDDYEEGTFTPTIVGTTTAGTGTYNTQRGDYIKIGRLVTAQFYIAWTAHTGTGNMNVSGLPFTTQNVGTYLAAAAIGFVDSISMTAGNIMTGYAGPNSTTMLLKQTPTGGGASTDIPIDTSGSIIVTLTYIANA